MKYILVGIIVYFILKRVLNIKTAISNDVPRSNSTYNDEEQFTDYEEVE